MMVAVDRIPYSFEISSFAQGTSFLSDNVAFQVPLRALIHRKTHTP